MKQTIIILAAIWGITISAHAQPNRINPPGLNADTIAVPPSPSTDAIINTNRHGNTEVIEEQAEPELPAQSTPPSDETGSGDEGDTSNDDNPEGNLDVGPNA